MKQSPLKFVKDNIDWIAIGIGCIALVLMFIQSNIYISTIFLFVTGIAGLCYLCYAAYLWFIKRVDFDWHLIDGHFLRKVIFVVISLPFTLTMFIMFMASMDADLSNPKELVFDDNLYTNNSPLPEQYL